MLSAYDVFHPYNDAPYPTAKVNCYSANEILAQKGRASDIYDIVNISRNFREDIDKVIARMALKKKFEFIGVLKKKGCMKQPFSERNPFAALHLERHSVPIYHPCPVLVISHPG